MKTRIRCQHCGADSYIDMGECGVCHHCKKFIISMSVFVKEEIDKSYKGIQDEQIN